MNQPDILVIADRSPLFKTALQQLLPCVVETPATLHADNAAQLDAKVAYQLRRHIPLSLVLVDRALPGLERFEQLVWTNNDRRVPVLLMAETLDASFIEEARERGIEGVISKCATPAQFGDAIQQLLRGKHWYWQLPPERPKQPPQFSALQHQVFELLRQGQRNKQIARQLQLPEHKVRYHVGRIYQKLEIPRNRILLAKSVRS